MRNAAAAAPDAGDRVRLVLDTNVVLSALLWHGTPSLLLQAARHRRLEGLFSSHPLLAELADVLTRPSPSRRLVAAGLNARKVMDDYLAVITLVAPASVPAVIADDPDDDEVLAAAVAAEANLIVSGDHHLLALESYRGIRIITPTVALALAGA